MNEFMRGVWLENGAAVYRENLPLPVPQTGEALIKVLLAGICGTDLQLLKGYYPFRGVPGHEFVGEVVLASDHPQLIGKRVVGEINIGCGHCTLCDNGLSKHCNKRSVAGIKNRNGAFAEFLSLPVANLHVIPDHLPNDMAVFTEPLAAAARILEQVAIKPEHHVLVIGAGRLGLLIAQVIHTVQCQLRVVARHDQQRKILKQWGITAIDEPALPIREADVVIEASGLPGGLQAAVDAVKPTGTIVLKSTYAGQSEFKFSRLVVDEISLVGSRCGPFAPALRLLHEGGIETAPLITGRFKFHQAQAAFAAAAQAGRLKVLLEPESAGP